MFQTDMNVIRTIKELRQAIADAKARGAVVGLVPTMGALHNGHVSLIDRARRECDFVVVSDFVNPTQFNNPDDLRTYPRTEEADCAKMEKAGVDVAFIPSVEDIYPEPDTRVFDLGPVAEVMEGAKRPGHFNGVAQIVSKLFDIVRPDKAYFGEKDFQQIAVIRRMVELEGFELEIVDCPIVREPDGLAMSSRNVRLDAAHRAAAPEIHRALEASREYAKSHNIAETERYVTDAVNAVEGLETEYFSIVDALTMQPIECDASPVGAVGCITVYCGDVRLIDNIKY